MADRGLDYLAGAASRIEAYSADCTQCGACFDVCPMPSAAGIGEADAPDAVRGLLSVLDDGQTTADSRTWTKACCGSGYCNDACPEGIDVRFLQRMGKIALLQQEGDPKTIKRRSVETYNSMANSVRAISGLLVETKILGRLQNVAPGKVAAAEPVDVVFYTGCNVWKTPHIVLTALDTLDAVDVSARVMGGPSMCCGVYGFNQGDGKISGRQAFGTVEKLAEAKTEQALSGCPSCQIQIGDLALGNWA